MCWLHILFRLLLVCDEWEKTEKNGEKALNFVLYFLIQPLVIVEYRTIVVVSSYDLYKSLVKQKFRDHPSEFEQYILHTDLKVAQE
jgi:hypothetical protein